MGGSGGRASREMQEWRRIWTNNIREMRKKTGTPFHTFLNSPNFPPHISEEFMRVKAGVEGHICRLTLFSDSFEETSCIKGNPCHIFLVCMCVRHRFSHHLFCWVNFKVCTL